jgi:hypothetical protein
MMVGSLQVKQTGIPYHGLAFSKSIEGISIANSPTITAGKQVDGKYGFTFD